MSINEGYQPLSKDTKEIIHKCKCNSSKLICMMIGKKVKDKVQQFRDTNNVARKGIQEMEWRAFKQIHFMG